MNDTEVKMNDTEIILIRDMNNNKQSNIKEKYSKPKCIVQCKSKQNYNLYNNNNAKTSKLNNSFPNKNNNIVYYDNTRETTLPKLNNKIVNCDNTRENNSSNLGVTPENNINNNNIEKENSATIENNNKVFNEKGEIKKQLPIENNKINPAKTMNFSFSQTNDDKAINVPKNNVIKNRKNCQCCYCYGPENNKFKSCLCCKPDKKYCCFINFLAYIWIFILFILLLLLFLFIISF